METKELTDREAVIIGAVLEFYGVELDRFFARLGSRRHDLVLPRQLCMMLIRRHAGYSLSRTGSIFGKGHGTVLHSEAKVQGYMDTYPQFRRDVETIEARALARLQALGWDVQAGDNGQPLPGVAPIYQSLVRRAERFSSQTYRLCVAEARAMTDAQRAELLRKYPRSRDALVGLVRLAERHRDSPGVCAEGWECDLAGIVWPEVQGGAAETAAGRCEEE